MDANIIYMRMYFLGITNAKHPQKITEHQTIIRMISFLNLFVSSDTKITIDQPITPHE